MVSISLVGLLLMGVLSVQAIDSTEMVKVKVQYKRDIVLHCGEKNQDDDNDDDNDDDGVKDAVDDDDDNDGLKDDYDDDDDNDGIKDQDETLNNLWEEVQFFRAPLGNSSEGQTGPAYQLIKPDGKLYHFNPKRNSLKIHNPKRSEIESSYSCNSSNPKKTLFFEFQILPYIYVPEYASFSNFEGEEVNISCKALFGLENGEKIQWKWKFDDKPIETVPNITYEVVNLENDSSLNLKNLTKDNRGSYKCTAFNKYGTHSRVIVLRIKDKFGFIWPVIGCVLVLILVAGVIIISEMIQKAKEKKYRDD